MTIFLFRKLGVNPQNLEHLLLAILNEKNSASQMMKDAGISLNQLQAAIQDLRKGEKVTGQSAEDTINRWVNMP